MLCSHAAASEDHFGAFQFPWGITYWRIQEGSGASLFNQTQATVCLHLKAVHAIVWFIRCEYRNVGGFSRVVMSYGLL